VVNFVNVCVEYSFLFPLVQKYKNRPTKAGVIIKNKVARFFGLQCISLLYSTLLTAYVLDLHSSYCTSFHCHHVCRPTTVFEELNDDNDDDDADDSSIHL